MQQWNKGLRLKGAVMSEEGQDIRQDLQEDCRAGGHETSIRIFRRAAEMNVRALWRGRSPPKRKKSVHTE
jgi:hypothetical protein